MGKASISEFLILITIATKDSSTFQYQVYMVAIYLRCFLSYQQDDWADILHFAEFAYNNVVHSSTHITSIPILRLYRFSSSLFGDRHPGATCQSSC